MRALLLALSALLAVAPPVAAADRLDALARELREGPLAIDSELSWFLDRAEERRLVRVLRASAVDVHVALVPQFEEDESGGDGDRIAAALHRRLQRPGLYLIVDQHGYFDVRAYDVPRRVSIDYDLQIPPAGRDATPADVIRRVDGVVDEVAAAPPGRTSDELPLSELRPYDRRYGDDRAATGDAALGAAIVGGMLGLFAGGVARRLTRGQGGPWAPGRRRGSAG